MSENSGIGDAEIARLLAESYEDAQMSEAFRGALLASTREIVRGKAPVRRFTRRAVAAALAAALVLFFAGGLLVGRTFCPREVVVTEQVRVSTPAPARVVRVEVPVVHERLVVKRVPVVRTRVIYRQAALPVSAVRALETAAPTPRPLARISIALHAEPLLPQASISHESHPARLAEPQPAEAPASGRGALPQPGDHAGRDGAKSASLARAESPSGETYR